MKKIVEYKPTGNCKDCGANAYLSIKYEVELFCLPFRSVIKNYRQCQACKDFLAQEANKVYCDGCTHSADYYRAHENGCGCELNSKTELDENGWHSLNCKQKEKV